MNEARLELNILTEAAQRLTELQRRLLQSLKDKGPGLLLEVAVRVLKFPEDVLEPLRQLQADGLVTTQTVSGGQFGGELYSLTAPGERVLQLLNDPAFQLARAAATPAPNPPTDARRQEAELLNKLGDLAKEKGDLDKAIEYYQQALSVTRDLAAEGK
jgi:tetratricopeptide (TPR) repeat protein